MYWIQTNHNILFKIMICRTCFNFNPNGGFTDHETVLEWVQNFWAAESVDTKGLPGYLKSVRNTWKDTRTKSANRATSKRWFVWKHGALFEVFIRAIKRIRYCVYFVHPHNICFLKKMSPADVPPSGIVCILSKNDRAHLHLWTTVTTA